MAYDVARQKTVLFGGFQTYAGPGSSDTWEWNGTIWQPAALTAASSTPPPTAHVYLTYDSARQTTVMFGGLVAGSGASSETWEYDGSKWEQLAMSPQDPKPSPRTGACLVFDSTRNLTVLYGGAIGPTMSQEVWEWDGSTWVNASPPATATQPAGRTECVLAYDPLRQRVVMFGGRTVASSFAGTNETWEWDGASRTWTQKLPAASPPNAYVGAMVWHARLQRVALVHPSSCTVWTWDGMIWRPRFASNYPAPVRTVCAAAYDTHRERIVIYGDYAGSVVFADTWEFDADVVLVASATAYGQGCAHTAGVPHLQEASLPIVGASFDARLTNCVPGHSMFVVGWSSMQWEAVPLPLALDPFGFPASCELHVSVDVPVWVNHVGTTATVSIPIPGAANLYGFQFYVQGFNVDPALSSNVALAASNALALRCGE